MLHASQPTTIADARAVQNNTLEIEFEPHRPGRDLSSSLARDRASRDRAISASEFADVLRIGHSERVRDSLTLRGLRLEYATLGWNVVGVPMLIVAAIRSGSAAAAGFGLDSAIEIGASLVVVWELTGAPKEREARGLRLIGFVFLAVAVYVTCKQLSRSLTATIRDTRFSALPGPARRAL